jgi:hypothetical protein
MRPIRIIGCFATSQAPTGHLLPVIILDKHQAVAFGHGFFDRDDHTESRQDFGCLHRLLSIQAGLDDRASLAEYGNSRPFAEALHEGLPDLLVREAVDKLALEDEPELHVVVHGNHPGNSIEDGSHSP